MARTTVVLPSMLRAVVGVDTIEAEGATLDAALEDAFRKCPALKVHVVDERGAFRQHVLCFLNEQNTRWRDAAKRPLKDGDRITILQAVSGG
jgi:molybdopterin converting factor small subunit